MWEKRRFREAEDAEFEAVLGFDDVVRSALPEAALCGPRGGVRAPDQREALENERGAGKMARGAYDFR